MWPRQLPGALLCFANKWWARTDIDYLERYRDFENAPGYEYKTGSDFLQRLHDGGRHYVPIIDSAIYIPNPENKNDA